MFEMMFCIFYLKNLFFSFFLSTKRFQNFIFLQNVNIYFFEKINSKGKKQIEKLVRKNIGSILLNYSHNLILRWMKRDGHRMTWCAAPWRGNVTKVKLSHSSCLRLTLPNAKFNYYIIIIIL